MACRGLCTEIWTRTPVDNVVACFQSCLWSIILLPVWARHSFIEKWSLFLHLPWVWASLWLLWPIEYAGRDSMPILSLVLGGSWKPAATKVQLCWVSHAARSQVMWRGSTGWDLHMGRGKWHGDTSNYQTSNPCPESSQTNDPSQCHKAPKHLLVELFLSS